MSVWRAWRRFLCLFVGMVTWSAFAQLTISASPALETISFTPEIASLGGECPAVGKVALPPHAVISIEDVCSPTKWQTRAPSPMACATRVFAVLGVRFHGRPDLVLVEQLTLDRTHFHVQLFGVLENAHVERKNLATIERVEWCAGVAMKSEAVELPANSCQEPRQFAAAFDYETPLNNKILTNGFSFHLRVAGTPPVGFDIESAAAEVLSSFGRALTEWTSALQDNDVLLTPATRAFVRSRSSTSSGGFVLLTPPQVVRLLCPHTATFVVELNFGGDGVFSSNPAFRELARARLEGRTIALNMRDVTCFKTMPHVSNKQLALRDERCVNLLPVLTHELGHAFGIDHIENSKGWALMNPVLSARASLPGELDVKALISVLERSVTGARPGELEFRESAGLQAPEDWWAEVK